MNSKVSVHHWINVLLIGKTGVGKTTIINRLVKKYHFEEKWSTDSVTKYIQFVSAVIESNGETYNCRFIDTLGFLDANNENNQNLDDEKVILEMQKAMKKYTVDTKTINLVLYVIKKGRFDESDKRIFSLFKKSFTDKIKNVTTLVVTHCELMKDEQREKWVDEEIRTKESDFANFFMSKIYTVGFPDLRDQEEEAYTLYKDKADEDAKKLEDLILKAKMETDNGYLTADDIIAVPPPPPQRRRCVIM